MPGRSKTKGKVRTEKQGGKRKKVVRSSVLRKEERKPPPVKVAERGAKEAARALGSAI